MICYAKDNALMKKSRLIALFFTIPTIISLGACSSMNATAPNTKTQTSANPMPPKDPVTVSFYSNDKPLKHPYKILGKATVSKYNLVGIKRQEAVLKDKLRNLAAAAGGDAVINITRSKDAVTGTIITFEKKV